MKLRFTPARAGQTTRFFTSGWLLPVHPRVCGADFDLFWGSHFCSGSPPRVRGRPEVAAPVPERFRFTPACAGQTSEPIIAAWGFPVHPRVCGADMQTEFCGKSLSGSPPRVRGRLFLPARSFTTGRFTPACAGQTQLQSCITGDNPVHPRVCGADVQLFHPSPMLSGSPPRVRGRRKSGISISRGVRFTPACAGQTIRHSPARMPNSVHPRVCGADSHVSGFRSRHFGSPPRVRGRLQSVREKQDRFRFTPACAGQTNSHRWNVALTAVHPRVCGADAVLFLLRRCHAGSPPRVRGRHAQTKSSEGANRFTPACAGQTHLRNSDHCRLCGSPPRVRGRR